ncbi:ABC transporter permease [Egicoccus sp. AB-alg2]|uniref:ABC transporter permease n=1 Tax=Egicoccus sp. AB-alg2 TaxID=3242693 RepID=UPI00359D2843
MSQIDTGADRQEQPGEGPGTLERPSAKPVPRWRETLSVLLANRLAVFGLVLLALLLLTAIFADQLARYPINAQNLAERFSPPSGEYWFGTDELGRDLYSRVVMGSRISLQVGAVSVGISLVAGTLIGLIAGYRGGWVDTVWMRTMDVLFAFPVILLAIALVAVLGPSLRNTMIAVGIVFTPIFARVVRGSVLSVREELHVRAVRSLGASDWRIIGRHVLPNVAAPIIVQASLSLAFAILTEAALSFVGVGVQPPDPAWGLMLSDAQRYQTQGWWLSVFPGAAIFLTVMAFNLLGDGLRDALDPKQRSVIESRGVE